jgi:hypothetical protein
LIASPQADDPAQEWAETAGDIQFTAVISYFVMRMKTTTRAGVETPFFLSGPTLALAEH